MNTPIGNLSPTFAGDSLEITNSNGGVDGSGDLYLQSTVSTDTITVNNLILNNYGGVDQGATGAGAAPGTTQTLAGNITLSGSGGQFYTNGSSSATTSSGFGVTPQVLDVTANIGGSGNLLLTTANGTGFFITLNLSGANTYTGQTIISKSTLVVSSINSVEAGGTSLYTSSSLGAPTTVAAGTIELGDGSFSSSRSAELSYIGTGETTNRAINLGGNNNSGGTGFGDYIDQSGTGLLDFTSGVTAIPVGQAAQSHNLYLSGSTSGTGEIDGAIVDNSTANKTTLGKVGTGQWDLTGANTYSGGTTVSGGTLLINNASGSSGTGTGAVTTASGATLGGSGFIAPTVTAAGSFTIQSGGILASGTSGSAASGLTLKNAGASSTAGFANLTGATLAFNLGAVNTASTFSLTSSFANELSGLSGNTLTFTDLTSGSLNTGEYTLIGTDDSTTNPFNGLSLGTQAGFTLNGLGAYTTAGDVVQLEVNQLAGSSDYALQLDIIPGAVPEPSTWAMLLSGLGVLILVQRRRFIRAAAPGC